MTNMLHHKLTLLRKRGIPLNAIVELTTQCNLKCGFCFVAPAAIELTTEQVLSVIDRFAEAGIMALLFTGGEPFMRSDILPVLEHVIRRDFFDFTILSNGTLINSEHIKFLSSNTRYINLIRLSFFSHHASVHDEFTRVAGSFERALEAADMLNAAGVKVAVMINLTEDNIDEIKTTRAFFSDRGFVVHVGISKININDMVRTAYAGTTTEEFYKKYLSLCTDPDSRESMRKHDAERLLPNPHDAPLCESLFSLITIRANGDIVPCAAFKQHTVSNIFTDDRPLPEIFKTSELYRQLRPLKRSHLSECSSCRFIGSCTLCPGMMHTENGSWEKPMQQTCNYARAYHDVIYR